MLFRQTVEPETLSLLKELMALPVLNSFYLVGGTALALQIGHRKSIDLDFFCDSSHDQDKIIDSLPKPFMEFSRSEVFLGVNIHDIKCDFVKYLFPRIEPLVVEDEIRMANRLEIAGMKLWAITRRGTKKDFVDLYFLLREFSLREMFDFFSRKYPSIEPFMVMRSLTYFEDAEKDFMPVMIEKIEWPEVKARVSEAVRNFVNQN